MLCSPTRALPSSLLTLCRPQHSILFGVAIRSAKSQAPLLRKKHVRFVDPQSAVAELSPEEIRRAWMNRDSTQADPARTDVIESDNLEFPSRSAGLRGMSEDFPPVPFGLEKTTSREPASLKQMTLDPRRVAQMVSDHVGSRSASDLLKLKHNLRLPSPQERAEIELSSLGMLDLLSMPTTPSAIIKREKLSFTIDPNDASALDLEQHERRHGADLASYARYIRAVAEHGDYTRAEFAVNRLRSRGLVPDAHVYSALFVVYERASRGAFGAMAERARHLVKLMEQDGVQLTPHLVSTYVGVLCADIEASAAGSARLDAAFALVEALQKSGPEGEAALNVTVYTTLIKGCVRARDYKRAWAAFDHVNVWHTDRQRPGASAVDTVLYSLMIHVCALTGEAERALNLFEDMKSRQLQPTEVTFTALLGAFRFRPDMHAQAVGTLTQMRAAGYAPDHHTLLAFLDTMAHAGDKETAALTFDELRRLPSPRDPAALPHNLWERVYTALIIAHVFAMRRPGIHRTKLQSALIDDGEQLFYRYVAEVLHGEERRASVHALDAVLRLFTEAGRSNRAWAWRAKYDTLGVPPSFNTFKALIHMLARARRMERALDLFALCQREPYNFVPDVQVYAFLLMGCARQHYVTTGMRLLREMKRRELPLQPHFHFVLNFRRHLVKSPHLIREIDHLTGKAQRYIPGWHRPGGRRQSARMRAIGKEEQRRLEREPVFPLAQSVAAVSGSAGM